MAVRVKIQPFEKTIKIIVDRNLSPQARSQRVAAFARQEIEAADAQNAKVLGSAPPKTVTVDGKQGAALESVNPDRGVIIAEWRLVGEVLTWIMETLKQRSPVISGKYRDSHTLFADGSETNAANPPLAQEYTFLNPVPYSRKIEVGKTRAGRDFVIQVPNRIYERTADDAKARFGNIAKIRFTYQSAVGGSKATADRVPAIVVTLK
jgi:hypothetical protein